MLQKHSLLEQNVILPLRRNLNLMMANGRLYGQHHLVDFPQMTKVNTHIPKRLLTEFAGQRSTWTHLRVMKLHVCAQAARVSVGFATH